MRKITKKKLLAVVLTGTLTVSIAACGNSSASKDNSISKKSTTETTTSKKEVKLIESGYNISKSDSDRYLYYAATLENPNKDYALEFPKIIVTAKNKDGSILASDEQVLNFIAPGDKVSFASMTDCKGKTPYKVEITTDSGDYISSDSEQIMPTKTFKISNISESKGDFGEYSYTGEVENKGNRDISQVAVTILLKKKGKIVSGTTTFIDDLNAGSKKAFDTSEYNLPNHDEYVVSASSWE